MKINKSFIIVLMSFCITVTRCLAGPGDLYGKWTLIKDSSSPVMYYEGCSLDITSVNKGLKVKWIWQSKLPYIDSFYFKNGKLETTYKVLNRVWPYENFMGVSFVPGTTTKATLIWGVTDKDFDVHTSYPVRTSQGEGKIQTYYHYALSDSGTRLTVWVKRNTRNDTLKYVFERAALNYVYFYKVPAGSNEWMLSGNLHNNAFVISLQGLVNRDKAQLYLLYPEGWEYREDRPMKSFYEKELSYKFSQLNSINQLLKNFSPYIKGYIVWDTTSRSSLCVAFTLAGLKNAVVISEGMIPLMQKYHIKCAGDFRDRFNNMNDHDVFEWAYQQYGSQCNKKFLVWMGGVDGEQMMPAIADFGIAQRAFFTDLSTDPKDTAEYTLASRMMSDMQPLSLVMGWHSYNKDLERNYVTLTSHHGLRVEGLNTFPNLSFTSKTPPSPGFVFKNHHNIQAGIDYMPKKKVYITCVQTDGLGLGAWNKPGRGSIPYAWEVTINWAWMAPVMLEYYYKTATDKDYFFGSLSGPGYMYPKAIPDTLFDPLMKISDSLCRYLDLNVFETMDYSEGTSGHGNNDLSKPLVTRYFKSMKNIIGILNGYAPSYTFGTVNKKPFISYDYYLDETLPESAAVNDLKELIYLNRKRPYFLALHVREWNNIDRVKRILNQLGTDIEVVPLDIFMKMAGNSPSYSENYLNVAEK